jgi:predicted transcriptional regulator
MQVPGVEWLATECQQEIITTLTQRECATTRELGEEVGCSKEHARDTLRRLHKRGIVDVHENAGAHGAHLYRVLAGIDANATRPSEHVDLSPDDETTNKDVWEYYTWSLAVCSVTPSGSVMNRGATTETTAGSDITAGTEAVESVGDGDLEVTYHD